MKTIKKVLVTLVLMAFALNISIAQEKEAKEEKNQPCYHYIQIM